MNGMEKENVEGKRISLKRKAANPLFKEWLEDLHEEAKAKRSRLEPTLKEALTSLSRYPLPLHSGADCAVLQGFDKKLCKYLDKNLEVYKKYQLSSEHEAGRSSQEPDDVVSISSSCDTNYGQLPGTRAPPNSETTDSPATILSNNSANILPPVTLRETPSVPLLRTNSTGSSKSYKNNKSYKPKYRSGSYAILLALYEHSSGNPSEPAIKKDALIERAQKHSEESFTRPKPNSFYTAWSSMTNLVKKGLVCNQISKKSVWYSLTESGKALAKQLLEESKKITTMNDLIFNQPSCSHTVDLIEPENIPAIGDREILGPQGSYEDMRVDAEDLVELPAGTFDVILLIDKHETSGASKKNDPTIAQFNKYPDLKHDYRDLKVGDFTWVARHKEKTDIELVIPFIVERKRMDDLSASIKDGRFHEQKFRLRKCGIKNVIYLIENHGSNNNVGLPMQSLMQALANTRIHDDFKVQLTASLTDSAKFLAMMTKRLTVEYKDRNLVGWSREPQNDILMTFNFFNRSSVKNKPLNVSDTFIKVLLQVKGISVEKAVAIAQQYQTPNALKQEYNKCRSNREAEMLLADIKYGDTSRNVGPSVSKSIYQTFTWKHEN